MQLAETEAELARLCNAVEPKFTEEKLIFSPQALAFYLPDIFTVKTP